MSSGQTVGGSVTNWVPGYQVWMGVRAESTSYEVVQGPCQVSEGTFACSNAQTVGGSGTTDIIRVAVVTDATGNELRGASALPVEKAADADQTIVYVS